MRFHLSGKDPLNEFILYLPKDLGLKFTKAGTFSILSRILIVSNGNKNDWYETPLLESSKFTIFENLP